MGRSRYKIYEQQEAYFFTCTVVNWLPAFINPDIVQMILNSLSFLQQDRQYQFWQEGTHPKQIQSEAMLHQKVDYIHDNPVRRGYVDEPMHWRYSSARNYAGEPGLIEVTLAF